MAIGTPTNHAISTPLGSATTVTVQPTGTIPVGNHVILIVGTATSNATITAADTQSNTYQVDVTENATGRTIFIVSAKVTTQLTTSDTITVTYNGSVAQRTVRLLDVSGLAQTSWLDQSAHANGTSTTPSSGNVTTTQADELLIGNERNASPPNAITWGGSFTSLGSADTSGATQSSAYRIVSATGTYSAAGTITSAGWAAAIATYKAAAAAATFLPQILAS